MTTPPNPAAQPGIRDPRPKFDAAAKQIETLLENVDPATAGHPTPCDEFTVGQLVEHLQAVVRRVAHTLSTGSAEGSPTMVASTNWVPDFHDGTQQAREAMADDAVLGSMVTAPFGTLPAAAAITAWTGELITHAWDLAVATGQRDRLDDSLADGEIKNYERILLDDRTGIPFGQAYDVPADASEYDKLAAFTGRNPQFGA